MKKPILLLLLYLTFNLTFSQVTTSPTIPIATDEVTIIFNATGTGLDGFSGDIYAHTGVTIDGAKWQNVIAEWSTNIPKAKLTRDASNTNLYTLVISPDVYSFYGVDTSKKITELSFVFRSSDGSTKNGADIFIPLFESGLNIAFTQPTNNTVYNINDNITISAESSINADLELFVNGISQNTTTNSTTISTSYTFTSAGSYTLKVTAATTSENKETEISVFVKKPTQIATQPTGLKYGVNKNANNTVTFLLKAPLKNNVFILGDFNNWTLTEDYQLFKDDDDFWLTTPTLDVNTEYAYQYLIDDTIKVADPYSEKILDPWTDQYIKTGNYPNLKAYPTNLTTGYVSTFLINETAYNWNVSNFTRPTQDNLIIYELHIRDFTESDSYTEALTKLDYLQSLGINAIELMPVNEFEGADSWGYNPALYFALDKAYGTKNSFKKFVDECHNRGIAVLTDVVFNHSFDQSPMAQMYWNSADSKPAADNPWYNEDHNLVDNTSAHWGNDFNHESPLTVEFFNDVLNYWMAEYKIDGFRFDFTKGFSNTIYTGADNWASAYDATRISILKNYADTVWNFAPTNKPYVIFEHLSDNSEEKELANYGIMLWGNMNHNYNQNTMGWTSDTDLSWISYKQRDWNNANVVGYMESHDEERLMFKNLQFGNSSNTDHNVTNLNTALSRQELAGMFFFTIPGPKMIWQFGELGYDVSIDDPDRVGRKPLHWEYFDDAHRKQIYNTWATLIEFKKQLPVFNTSDFTLNVSDLTKTITLKHASMDVVIVGNFDVTSKTISTNFTKTGTWYEYFTGEEKALTNTSENITLNPGEYKLYSTEKLTDPRGGTASDDSDNDGVADTLDMCPNTMEGLTVNATGCPIFLLASNNFTVTSNGETCPNKNNGTIVISATENYNYETTINGKTYNFTSSVTTNDLAPGNYDFCVSISDKNYEQCFNLTIPAGTTISGKATVKSNKVSINIEQGTAPFNVLINNKTVLKTSEHSFIIDANHGDYIEVKSNKTCEGVLSKSVNLLDAFVAYPNPTNGNVAISLPIYEEEINIEIYNMQSQLISNKTYKVISGKVQLNLENKPNGIYFAKINSHSPLAIKIIKY